MTHPGIPVYQLLSQRLSHVIIKKFNDTQTFSILQLKNLSLVGVWFLTRQHFYVTWSFLE